MIPYNILNDLAALWYILYPILFLVIGFVAKQAGVLRYLAGILHVVPYLKVVFRLPESYQLRGVPGDPTIATLNAEINNRPRWKFLASNAHNVQMQLLLRNYPTGRVQRFSPIVWDLNTKETRIEEMVVGPYTRFASPAIH